MTPGEIEVDGAGRVFKVYPRESRRLKDLVIARRGSRATEVVALRDVSFNVEPGSAVGLVGRNGSGKTTLLRLLSGIIRPTSGHVEVGGRVGSLLELGAGFHPDLSGRENVFLNGSIHGLKRAYIREQLDEIVAFAGLEEFIDLPVRTYSSGMYMRLGFAIAAHIDADVLLLDEVFAVGDEQFQRKCFGKIFEFKQRGGTRIEEVALLGPDGDERTQLLGGEPFALRLRISSGAEIPPPRVSFELRDSSGLLLAGESQSTADLGWNGGGGAIRFEVDRPPLGDGRFHLRLGLADDSGERLYHWLDDALTFVVYPPGDERGVVRLEGRWEKEENGGPAETV